MESTHASGKSSKVPQYTATAVHFDVVELPALLSKHLPHGPLALADLGCGDGPMFSVLEKGGFIGASKPVYAVDLSAERLRRVAARFPYITTLAGSVEDVSQIAEGSLDFVISTMTLEHVEDDGRFLVQIGRMLRPGGKAYLTTVYKKRWAWYFRKRNGQSVLDTSHVREYTDINALKSLVVEKAALCLIQTEVRHLWFPLLDPIAFRVLRNRDAFKSRLLRLLRMFKVPIPGYYSVELVLNRPMEASSGMDK